MNPWQSWALAAILGCALYYYYSQGAKRSSKAMMGAAGSDIKLASQRDGKELDKEAKYTSLKKSTDKARGKVGNRLSADSSRKPRKGTVMPTSGSGRLTANANLGSIGADTGAGFSHEEMPPQLSGRQNESHSELLERRFNHDNSASSIGMATKERQANDKKPGQSNSAIAPVSTIKDAGDVSDMVPSSRSAVSIMRIVGNESAKTSKNTGNENAKETNKGRQNAKETKKQRQNHRKAEEQRQQRADDEQKRLLLLENQRRAARLARGETTGASTLSLAGPANGAWETVRKNGRTERSTSQVANGSPHRATQLLDTFDSDTTYASSQEPPPDAITPARIASISEAPTESEPSDRYKPKVFNEVDVWSEVPSKKKKLKSEAGAISSLRQSTVITNHASYSNPRSITVQSRMGNIENDRYMASTSRGPQVGHPEDSDWIA